MKRINFVVPDLFQREGEGKVGFKAGPSGQVSRGNIHCWCGLAENRESLAPGPPWQGGLGGSWIGLIHSYSSVIDRVLPGIFPPGWPRPHRPPGSNPALICAVLAMCAH